MGKVYTKEKLERYIQRNEREENKWERYIQRKNWKGIYRGTKERKINGESIYKGKMGKLYTKEKWKRCI
jgi:hypothetical protein